MATPENPNPTLASYVTQCSWYGTQNGPETFKVIGKAPPAGYMLHLKITDTELTERVATIPRKRWICNTFILKPKIYLDKQGTRQSHSNYSPGTKPSSEILFPHAIRKRITNLQRPEILCVNLNLTKIPIHLSQDTADHFQKMASQISTLLSTLNLHSSLPLTDPTSLYKIFQSLFLIECPTEDATTLQNIQLNAAFLEYLSTQRVSRVKELLRAWWVQSLKSEIEEDGKGEDEDGGRDEKGKEAGKEAGEDMKWEDGGEISAKEILGELERYITDGVNNVCVCFDGQEVEAIVKMGEMRRKVNGILENATSSFWPSFICQTREVV
ncbi:hypothetical protein DL98DRAFT_591856 [Cadophora sp. DSE1049]|nr:hypothetical protein DL98DRAFT_591856 [Cadophora sp. DSE1049]